MNIISNPSRKSIFLSGVERQTLSATIEQAGQQLTRLEQEHTDAAGKLQELSAQVNAATELANKTNDDLEKWIKLAKAFDPDKVGDLTKAADEIGKLLSRREGLRLVLDKIKTSRTMAQSDVSLIERQVNDLDRRKKNWVDKLAADDQHRHIQAELANNPSMATPMALAAGLTVHQMLDRYEVTEWRAEK